MNNRNVVCNNLIWRFAERFGAQIVSFLVSVVLARILVPSDYGIVALLSAFITILQVFVDSGLGNALIQKKEADNVDFSTVFFTNIVFCIIVYIVIYFFAPFISSFFDMGDLTIYVRVLGVTVLISGIKNVQQAYVAKNLLFKKFFFSTLCGTITAAIVGIIMACCGLGVWALIAQHLVNLIVDTIILWFTVGWRPHITFSFQRLKGLFSFGKNLLFSDLLNTLYNELRQFVIGKIYSSEDLAFYNQGQKLPHLIVTNVNTSIDSVLLPIMSKEQDDINRIKIMVRRSIKTSTYIMAPLMLGLFFCAENVVTILWTEKWLFCVPFLRIFCITYIFYPINSANLNAIKAIGRSDLFLRLEIIKKIIGIFILLTTMWFGVNYIAYGLLVNSFISQFINAYPNKKLLNYSYFYQFRDIFPSIALAILMGIVVFLIGYLNISSILLLSIQIFVGGFIYIFISYIVRLEAFYYLFDIIKSVYIKKRK